MTHSDLLQRLGKMRTMIRARLVVYGLCAVMSGGVVAFLTIVTLDRLLWLLVAGNCYFIRTVADVID